MKLVTGIILRFLGNWSLMQLHVIENLVTVSQFNDKFDKIRLQFDSFKIFFAKTQCYVT